MFKKILRSCFFIILSIFITLSTLFTSKNTVEALQTSSDNTEENGLGIVIEESSDPLDSSKTIAAPDLVDDQVFPFIPGFGKNSGKD